MLDKCVIPLLIFFVICMNQCTFILCGPVSSCSRNATDACCSLVTFPLPNDTFVAVGLEYGLLRPPPNYNYMYCGTDDPDEPSLQSKVDAIGTAFSTLNCFDGQFAVQPGVAIRDLTFSGWETLMTRMGCQINFKWNGSYSDWGPPSSCQPTTSTLCTSGTLTVEGIQTMTRTCTNPRAYNGGDNCTRLGPSTQTIPCEYICPTPTPTRAPTKSTPTIISRVTSAPVIFTNGFTVISSISISFITSILIGVTIVGIMGR